MRRVLWFLVVAAIAVAVAWWLAALPGHVSATIAGVTVEASAPIAVLAFVVLLLVLYFLLRLLTWPVRAVARWRGWRIGRHRAGGDAAVTGALLALAAGSASDARREAQRARVLLGDTPQTLLLAAEASRLAGKNSDAEAIYRKLAERGDAAFLGLRGLFRQAVAREDWPAAQRLVQEAEAIHPGIGWLREERQVLAERTGDWAGALTLAGPAPAARLAYSIAAADAATDSARGEKLARKVFNDNPGFAPAALAYARRLRANGQESRAIDAVRSAWKRAPQPDLAAFALASISNPLSKMKVAEAFARTAPDHPESSFLLARVALEAGLTGEARKHAAKAKQAGMRDRRIYTLLGEIEAAEHGDSEAGRTAQRELLREAVTAEPDPVWRCDACGTAHAEWAPVCPNCHVAGRFHWGGPARLALAAQ